MLCADGVLVSPASLLARPEVEDFGEHPYNQFPDFTGYRLFSRRLFKLGQHQFGRCTAYTHKTFEGGRLKSSAPTWARSSLRGGRHGSPGSHRMGSLEREGAVQDGAWRIQKR